MAKIFLSYPVLGKPELNSIFSIYQAILSKPEHQVRLYANLNDSLISRVRNVHLSVFYNDYPECDYFMSIDSDIEIENAGVNDNIFSKLTGHNLDFVGGLYALKRQSGRGCASISVDETIPEFQSGLKEMKWLSSGCWCIKRSAIERMIKAYPELMYDGDDNATGKLVYGLYIPMLYTLKAEDFPKYQLKTNRKYLSEDWSFCERWKAIGGKIYADTSISLKHIGSKDYRLWDIKKVQYQKPNLPPPGWDLGRIQ